MSINKPALSFCIQVSCSALLIVGSLSASASESCSGFFEQQHYQSALEKCTLDAKHHSLNANFILGELYINGLGTKKDIAKGLSYHQLATLSNNVDSELALGKYYAQNKDYLQSHVFFSLALDSGSLSALDFKESAEKNLSAQELTLSKGYLSVLKSAIAQQRKQLAGN
ncbi:sel1 repeat family protein [sulfur-oxidizing endosymbiont of Gigantopelta aegis]|uniref:sel1 repeat family protein n=1 Tax=sulfur-oxidizing endosymbiont of Gigantopelta aegis TaxID=2794934 RepID=UPI0018DB5937|nr:sel1 repeat family protein [sulfur-oxidizing endosymbiont of Gigantopelta aegis]